MSVLETLKRRAAAQVAQYPQYATHFDDCTLGIAKRAVRTKMGLVFDKDDVLLVFPPHKLIRQSPEPGFVAVWSMRNKCTTHVPVSSVKVEK
jgi:hypothetical protein